MLHELLERGERPWTDPLQLVGNERLEQPPERAALQDDLGLTRQQGLIFLWLHAPFVPCPSHEWNPHTLISEGAPLVPDEPTLADRDTPAEIAGSLGADTLRERSLAAGVEDCLGPKPDVLQPRQTGPDDLGGRFDADGCSKPDHPHTLADELWGRVLTSSARTPR
jgi:hypothetical protein